MQKKRISNAYGQKPSQRFDSYTIEKPAKLLDWLLSHLQESRTKIKSTLSGHGIKVNNKIVTQFDFPLQAGMRISVSKSKQNMEFKNRYVHIVYEDRYLLIVDKKPGILSMAAGHSTLNVKTVLDDYLKQTRQHCTAHIVHRLDRDTSGLMVYAKDKETELVFESDWHNIVFDRRYVAVLSGVMEQDEGTVESWLKDNKAYFTYSSSYDNGGKYALTHYRVLARTDAHSLVEFKLKTGRKNQIRVHAIELGHPVCGDVKYGNGDNPIDRLCLHAYRLCLYHPVTHKPMEFETEIPRSFTSLFNEWSSPNGAGLFHDDARSNR